MKISKNAQTMEVPARHYTVAEESREMLLTKHHAICIRAGISRDRSINSRRG